MKTALGRISTSRKWGRGIPGERSSLNNVTKVENPGRYGILEGSGEGRKDRTF